MMVDEKNSLLYDSIIEELREEIEEVVKREKILGLAIALVDEERIIWSEGFGFTDTTKKDIVTADTLFSTQSMGKSITATTFMILASKGLIDLDDPIRKHYPEFTVNTKFGNQDEEIEKITFRRMLSHTAGFTHEALVGNNFDNTQCTFEEHIASVADTWLRNKVGAQYAYSNIGMDLTAYVLGRIRNKSYPEVVKEELFQPLGIINGTLNLIEASNHSFAKGSSGDYQCPVVQVPMLGAGGVYISVNEQALFAMLHLNKGSFKGKQLIPANIFEEMYKPQFEQDGVELFYKLGIYQEEPIGDAEVFCHGGGGYGYATQHSWIPKHKISAIVFTNSSHHSGEQVKLARKALELMYKEKTKPKVVNVKPDDLQKIIGTYIGHRFGLRNIVIEKGKLYMYNLHGTKQLLYPQSSTEFTTEKGELLVFRFAEQQQGDITLHYKTKDNVYILKQNDSPNDRKGPDKSEWTKYLGIYKYTLYGVNYYLGLSVINGYLYLLESENMKLMEHKDNIYFTMDGESVFLDEKKMYSRNIPLTKIDLDLDMLLEDCKTNINQKYGLRWSLGSLAGIIHLQNGFETAFDFLLKTIEIDDIFMFSLEIFGNKLYGLREFNYAKKCFEKLLELDKENKKIENMLKQIAKEQN